MMTCLQARIPSSKQEHITVGWPHSVIAVWPSFGPVPSNSASTACQLFDSADLVSSLQASLYNPKAHNTSKWLLFALKVVNVP